MENKEKIKIWPFILAIILVIIVIIGVFFYYATASPSQPKYSMKEIKNPINQTNTTFEKALANFNKDYVDYIVFAIGGWKLHNPPLSKDVPKIKIILDDEIYKSEIKDTEIYTSKEDFDNEDISIITTKEEITRAILSLDIKEYMEDSIQEGKTTLELRAGYTKLFLKGYLDLYKDITGKSLTGEAVRKLRD
jgi:hypothetical protein